MINLKQEKNVDKQTRQYTMFSNYTRAIRSSHLTITIGHKHRVLRRSKCPIVRDDRREDNFTGTEVNRPSTVTRHVKTIRHAHTQTIFSGRVPVGNERLARNDIQDETRSIKVTLRSRTFRTARRLEFLTGPVGMRET